MGPMPEGTDSRHVRPELPYYGTYGSANYDPGTQNLSPQYVTNSDGQSWTALHDPWITRSPPEVADPHYVRPALLPHDTFGSGVYEPGAQEFLPQHSTCSEEQKSVLRELWGSPSEVADPHHVRPELLPDPNSRFTSYGLEAQDPLSQYATYSEGQTWPALRDPQVTETLPGKVDSYLCQPHTARPQAVALWNQVH